MWKGYKYSLAASSRPSYPFRILSPPRRFRCGHEATLAKAVQPSLSNDLGKWLGRKELYLLNLRWFSK